MTFEILHKPTFTNQLLAQPRNRIPQIIEKIEFLRHDPSPHGSVKKKLHGTKGNVYRLRSGDYRILYTYGDGYVALLGVDDRKDVYDHLGRLVWEEVDVGHGPIGSIDIIESVEKVEQPSHSSEPKPQSTPLPMEITEDHLRRLHVAEHFLPALCSCRTDEDLIAADVPEDIRNRVFDAVISPDIEEVLAEPTFVTGDAEDLIRFVEGELLGFLLKLDPAQERLVEWAVEGGGPTLIKGGPGTGKSMIALYRARGMIRSLRGAGVEQPRILFTTYTTSLVAVSQQLLHRLLGDDDRCVTVRTADSVIREIVVPVDGQPRIAKDIDMQEALAAAIESSPFEGNALQRQAQAQTIERLTPHYLLEEFATVIEARELASLDAYLNAPRTGRLVPLNATQRTAVWAIYTAFKRILARKGLKTWSQLRRRALDIVRAGGSQEKFDGVIVDETQDLDPTVLRLLVTLAKETNRIFVTADANQSIYGSSFRWADVHEDLRFRGRTEILRRNYRSTREIGVAAQSYLQAGSLESQEEETDYVENGPLPTLRSAATDQEELDLLSRFFRQATRVFRLGLGAGVVLVPTADFGRAISENLSAAGLDACFMSGRDLDLERRAIKVLTLKSAKGLEFPLVAIAGFATRPDVGKPREAADEEVEEWLARERRTLFVGMTRAMRALLVVVPAQTSSALLDGFDADLWNTRPEQSA